MTSRADDEKFMARAIEVSLRHQGQTETNPSVGCVLVNQGLLQLEALCSVTLNDDLALLVASNLGLLSHV